MTKQIERKWVIAVNGGYFDGFAGGKPIEQAKRYDLSTARTLNRVIMCGNGKIKRLSSIEGGFEHR